MKHLYSLSLLLLALLLPATAIAHDFEVDGIYYNINGNEVTVTYRGTNNWNHNTYSGDVTIPATVTYGGTTYSVTSIGDNAFNRCGGLTSISIPNSVTTIGNSVFSSCSGLTSVTIPNSVTSIGNSAFSGCRGLTSIDIPNSVAAIGDGVFSSCSGLTSVTIPNSVISIGNSAFSGCSSLAYVTIGNSVTSIRNYTFSRCSSLTSIDIPNSVTSIGNYAFQYCSSLTSLTIGNSVTSTIGRDTFQGCSSITNITVTSGNPKYDSRGNCNAIIETATNTLILGCQNTTIPNSVTTIGDYAFSGCTGLTSITIPNSVTEIGNGPFAECSGLTSITVDNQNPVYNSRDNCNAIIETNTNALVAGCMNTVIPSCIRFICFSAFEGCSGLTSITIPNTVIDIGINAFSGCSGLTSIDIPNSVTSIGDGAFSGCSGLASVTIGNSVTYIGDYAFYECNSFTSVDIPNSVAYIGNNAFWGCTGLTSVAIGNSVGYIGYFAFDCCSITSVYITDLAAWCNIYFAEDEFVYLSNPLMYGPHFYLNGDEVKDLVIPNSVTSINDGVFAGGNFTSATIPNSVTSIGSGAFGYCSELTSISIGSSVTSIGIYAFDSCIGLNQIYSFALTPPPAGFFDCNGGGNRYGATVFVPDIVIDKYQASDSWKDFTNIVGVPYTFEVGGTSYHATTMNKASVMAKNDEGLLYSGEVVIPDSVTYEGYTFAVTGIEGNAFEDCYELTSITIPNSVETIGEQAFQGCTGLTSVTIGSGVTAIGAKAFNYCNALEAVKCLGTVPPVMASTDCFSTAAYNRATLLVPRQQIETYQAADYWYKFAHIDGWGSAGRGDIDGDGVVSIRDVTRMIDAILTGEHEGVYFESADLNLNGRLDIGDVTTIVDMLLNDIE